MQKPDTLTAHIRASLRLGLPLIGAQVAQMGIGFVDTVMLGRLGAAPLAASVLATGAFFIVLVAGMGLAQAVMPMVAQAIGAGDRRGVRRAVRMGLWVVTGYGVLMTPLLWQAERIFLSLGQLPDISAMAGDYIRAVLPGVFPALVLAAFRSYLAAAERTQIVLWVTVAGVAVNGLLDYALIFGAFGLPRLEIVGAAIASALTNLLMCLAIVAYAAWLPVLRKYDVFSRLWRADWGAIRDVVRLGVPISLTIVAEVAMFVIAAVFMGWVGTVPLAAHGIAAQISAMAFMVPLSLAQVGTVRVGTYQGRRDAGNLRHAANAIMVLGLGFALVSAAAFLAIPELLIILYLDADNPNAAEIVAYGVPLLAVAAAFQVFDTLQVVGSNLLRGLKDSRVPMVYALFSYWAVGVPVSYGLGIAAGWGGVGVWVGLASGLGVAAVLMNLRFARRHRLGLVTA